MKIQKPKHSLKNALTDTGALLLGSFLYAVGINLFILPGEIVVGGLTGIATVLNLLFDTPVGTVTLLLNLPLMLLYMRFYGFGSLVKTVFSVVVSSIFTDLITFFPVTNTDPLFCSIVGGVTMGGAVGILFSRGYTSGGTDLAAFLLKKRFQNLSAGNLILILDGAIIVGSAFFTENTIGIFYSVVTTFLWSKMLDFVSEVFGRSKIVFVMSDRYEEIADTVNRDFVRGVTVLKGEGWYTKKDRPVLLCAVKRNELFRLKQMIMGLDPDAFVICTDANEVVGQGFAGK